MGKWEYPRRGPRKADDLRVDYARNYLENHAVLEYFDAINPDTPEALEEAKDKLSPLLRHSPSPSNLVSVGVGSGEEMQAAISMYQGSSIVVHGLDISPSAVGLSHRHLAKYGLSAIVTEGSAINMPYPPGSIDIFVLSAIMHEIYSYVPDGRQAWVQAIREVADKTSPGGVLLLRDFAAPDYDGPVRLVFRSRIASDFYDYFSREFRAFSAADQGMREAMLDQRSGSDSYLPALISGRAEIELPASAAAEVMLHFKNFSDHVNRGFTFLGDQSWKEVNEAYLPPDPYAVGFYPMPQSEYVSRAESVMATTLRTGPYSMICVENGRSARPKHAAFLAQHFVVSYPNSTLRSEDVIADFTCKMELVFRKVSP